MMKKKLALLTLMIFTLVVGSNQKSLSFNRVPIEPVSNYMVIDNASYVYDMVDFRIAKGLTTVTIYNYNNNVVCSVNLPYAGIYPTFIQSPAGTYKAVLTGYNIYEVDYFVKLSD